MIRRVYSNMEEGLSICLVGALCIVVTLQVFCRLVIRQPLAWSEELATILFVWTTMIGSSLPEAGRALRVELLHRRLPDGLRRLARMLVALLVIVFSLILLIQGAKMAMLNVRVVTPAMEISRAIPFAAVPVGGLLMTLRASRCLCGPSGVRR